VAIQGIESAAAFQDAQNMNAYLQLLNEVLTKAFVVDCWSADCVTLTA
jgi:hypothetical protein